MQYLLDTHVLIWWITSHLRRTVIARSPGADHRNTLHWSVAGSWEIAIRHALGRLLFDEPPEVLIPVELDRNHIETLHISNTHAFKAGQLPAHHRDPFDRMLVAQAQIESLGIVSDDSKLGLYDVNVFW